MEDSEAIAKRQNEASNCVLTNHANLTRFREDFKNSVDLFSLLHEVGRNSGAGLEFIQYRIIAARHAAMSVWHFSQALSAIRQNLPACGTPYLNADAKRLRGAAKAFRRHFPHVDNVRNTVAHLGELWKDPMTMKRNADDRGVQMFQRLKDWTYSVSQTGQIFSVTLTYDEMAKLDEIIEQVTRALGSPLGPNVPQS